MTDNPINAPALREIADWLDTYDALAEAFFNLLVQTGRVSQAGTQEVRAAARGKDVQEDLRRWADELESETSGPSAALKVLMDYGQIDGDHHKAWVIDQAVRALLGNAYESTIEEFCNPDSDDEYEWDEGVAP